MTAAPEQWSPSQRHPGTRVYPASQECGSLAGGTSWDSQKVVGSTGRRPVPGTRPPGSRARPAASSHATNLATPAITPGKLVTHDAKDEVDVVARSERATVRVGDVFLKVDADARLDVEVEAMALAPVPTHPGNDARAPGRAVGRVAGGMGRGGRRHPGAARRTPASPAGPRRGGPGRSIGALAAELDEECALLVTHGLLPAGLLTRNRQVAEAALRPWTAAFTHGDLQIAHVVADATRACCESGSCWLMITCCGTWGSDERPVGPG